MSPIKKTAYLLVFLLASTACLWGTIDFIVTRAYGIRGFSKFFASDNGVGYINNPNFSGYFGGPLDNFYAKVNIGPHGERISAPSDCKNPVRALFFGDSVLAGFEVNDAETFVSNINLICDRYSIAGLNFGVRAHDTHMELANYKRVGGLFPHELVLLFVNGNDFQENLDKLIYPNLVKKFGRAWNGEVFRPSISEVEKAYLSFRIFLSDNFYLTAKIIQLWEKQTWARRDSHENDFSEARLEKLVQLLSDFSGVAKSNKAQLIVLLTPCLVSSEPCAQREYERRLVELSRVNQQFVVIPLASYLERKFQDGELDRDALRFRSDIHLSKYGHKVAADTIKALLNPREYPESASGMTVHASAERSK